VHLRHRHRHAAGDAGDAQQHLQGERGERCFRLPARGLGAGRGRSAVALRGYARLAGLPEDELLVDLRAELAGGYAWAFCVGEGVWNVGCGLPRESRRRIGRWSRGLERIFEDVIKEGVAKGEFRSDLDVRLATLAILGMCNAASSWQRKENIDVADIAEEFARLVTEGMGKRPSARRKRR